MTSKRFEKIEEELVVSINANEIEVITSLYQELKDYHVDDINQMPEVVYARYLSLLDRVKKILNK